MKIDWDDYFLNIAKAVSERGSCTRKKVGAVIVRDFDKRIVGTGYNGAPSGEPECLDVGCDVVNDHCVRSIHAEENALNYSIINPVLNYTLYVTLEPCAKCNKLIENYRINRVVWAQSQSSYEEEKKSK